MKHLISSKSFFGLLAVCFLTALTMGPLSAKKKKNVNHPIKILKARYQNDQTRGGNSSARGNLTIWMQNVVGVAVDGIEVEVDLYNDRRRKVETLKKKIDKLEAGEKKVITFRWDVIAEDRVKPRFFVEYNSRGAQKARFEGDSPNWQ